MSQQMPRTTEEDRQPVVLRELPLPVELLSDEQAEQVGGGLTYTLDRCVVKSWSTSG
jgi:hypothetical protein